MSREEVVIELISQQFKQVCEGKEPQRLKKMLEEYELDPLVSSIKKKADVINVMLITYILCHDFVKMGFFIQRNSTVIPSKDHFNSIARSGSAESLAQYSTAMKEFVQSLGEGNKGIKLQLQNSILGYVLKVLSKYYINYKMEDAKKWVSFRNESVLSCGHSIEGDYIVFRKDEGVDYQDANGVLFEKIKELALIASKMSKFE